jgi:hypothetical protein
VVAGADLERARDGTGQIRDQTSTGIHPLQNLAGAWQQRATGFGQGNAAPDAIEDRGAQILFQGGDALADGRLGQVQLRRRPRKGSLGGHGHESSQQIQVHR